MSDIKRRHPLASLTAAEIEHATRAFRAATAPAVLTFYEVSLHEPWETEEKEAAFGAVGDHIHGALPGRRAKVIAGEPSRMRLLEGHAPVNATSTMPVVFYELKDTQPAFTSDEYALGERLVVEHVPFRTACAARGLNADDVRVDPWCPGWIDAGDDPSRRLAVPILYLQRGDESAGDCLYLQPLDGVNMVLNMWSEPPTVVSFEWDDDAPPPPPPDPIMRFPTAADGSELGPRPRLAPLRTLQPGGPGFELSAEGVLRWQRWECTIGFNAREGAVLSCVKYAGRPVAWRLSFAEMVVPYADPHAPHHRKAAFDAGEDGLGRNAHSLDPTRCDCAPGAAAAFLDAALVTAAGEGDVLRRAICVHEEDGGLLWKHLDWRTGASVARRSRHLVIMFLTTIANYTYGFSFKLGLDASIHMEATLTGILSIGALHSEKPRRPWGQTLSRALPGAHSVLYGPDHQHFFCARLDMAVDGLANTVVEVSVEPHSALATTSTRSHRSDDDDHDDHEEEDRFAETQGRHNAFRRVTTPLLTECAAARDGDPRSGRHWLVQSATRTNAVGEPTAWRLEPGSGSAIFPACDPRAAFLSRAGFLRKNLWVTGYRPEERYPGGDYPNQRPPSRPDGLDHWTRRDAPIEARDVVLWHVFGVTHLVRTEDAPVMPCERVGFALQPCGFFDSSPCTDVPCDACAIAQPTSKL
jgi:primary-amine oxidase